MSDKTDDFSWEGKNVVLMSGTTHYWMGRCVGEDLFHFYLKESGWIPYIGRHNEVFRTGKPCNDTEYEPHNPDAIWAIPKQGTIISEWLFPLWLGPLPSA